MATNKPTNPLGTTPYLFYTGTLATSVQADASKMTSGWNTAGEKPKRNHQNGLFKYLTQFIQHVNDYGVPHWDTDSSYLAGSWARSTVDGKVYVCILDADNTRGEPSATATYWTRFDLYFSPQATETVQGSSEVATDAEAQGLALDDKMLTPLKLKNAMKGANQSLGANGYQKLPGGLIMQWGTVSVTSAGSGSGSEVAVTFPIAFSTACDSIQATVEMGAGAVTGNISTYHRSKSTTGVNIGLDHSEGAGAGTHDVSWLAIGR